MYRNLGSIKLTLDSAYRAKAAEKPKMPFTSCEMAIPSEKMVKMCNELPDMYKTKAVKPTERIDAVPMPMADCNSKNVKKCGPQE